MMTPIPQYLDHPTPKQLKEIYHLRVSAWAPDPSFNASQYPDGLVDALDQTAHHWIIEEGGRIIAAARVAVVEQLSDIPNWEMYRRCQFPTGSPVAYLSRLVIHPDYQRLGWSNRFDVARLQFIDQAEIPLTIGAVDSRRVDILRQQSFVFAGMADTRYHFYKSITYVYFRLHPKLVYMT